MSALKLFECLSQLGKSNPRPTVYETVRTSNNVPRLSSFSFQHWNSSDSLLFASPRSRLVRDSGRRPTVQFHGPRNAATVLPFTRPDGDVELWRLNSSGWFDAGGVHYDSPLKRNPGLTQWQRVGLGAR